MRPIWGRSFRHAFVATICVSILAAGYAGAQAPVPKTGQQGCWDAAGTAVSCAGTGQDGEYQAGVPWPNPRFVNVGNGSIIDSLTGLSWLQDAGCFAGQTWENALLEIGHLNSSSRTCSGYAPGTYNDWRLPNVREYASLWDYGESGPALPDDHLFLNGPFGDYWSSTTSYKFQTRAWTGYAGNGEVFDEDENKTQIAGVWAVRGPVAAAPAPVPKTGQQECWNASGSNIPCVGTGQDGETMIGVTWPNPRFTDLGNGTVADNLTGLTWLKDSECFNWQAWTSALSEVASLNAGTRACAGYTPGAFNDWRLANVREMLSLWDYGRDDPALPEFHPFVNVQTPGTSYWTSSTVASPTANAWKAKTYSGSNSRIQKTLSGRYGRFVAAPRSAVFSPMASSPAIPRPGPIPCPSQPHSAT